MEFRRVLFRSRQSGVDFRLHLAGSDLGDTDTAQLQCMAEAGGGRFFSASNADELAGALGEAVQVEPEPEPVVEPTGTIALTVTQNGDPIGAYTYVYKAGTEDEVTRNHALDSEEHTSELQSLMRHSYDVFCL